jgi:hypothetical protein
MRVPGQGRLVQAYDLNSRCQEVTNRTYRLPKCRGRHYAVNDITTNGLGG